MSTSVEAISVFAAMQGRWLIEFSPRGLNRWRPCYDKFDGPLIVTTLAQGIVDVGHYNHRAGAEYRCIATTETDEEIIKRSQIGR